MLLSPLHKSGLPAFFHLRIMQYKLYIIVLVSAVFIFDAPGASAAPRPGAQCHERAALQRFRDGDYLAQAKELEALLTGNPTGAHAILHYPDFFRIAEHLGAERILNAAGRIREAIRSSNNEHVGACMLHFNCELERLLYRIDAERAKKLTDELMPIRTWTLFGPYRKYGPGDLDYPFQPEVVSAEGGIHPQKRIRVGESDGWLDPGKYLFPGRGVVYAKVSFKKGNSLTMRIFSGSRYAVFINGRPVLRNDETCRRAMRVITATGCRGITVMIKLYGSPFEKMRLLVTDEHDRPVSPNIEQDASFAGECDVKEVLDPPYAALVAERAENMQRAAHLAHYFDNLDSDEALEHYRDSLAAKNDPYIRYRLAASLLTAGTDLFPGRQAEGVGILDRLIKEEPHFYPARLKRLESLMGAGDMETACRDAAALVACMPGNPGAHIMLLRMLCILGYEKEFIESAEKARRLFPVSAGIMAVEADFYRTRDRKRYLDYLRELLIKDFTPERAGALIRDCISRGDYTEALELIRSYNFNNDFSDEMIEIYMRQGDFQSARNCILPELVTRERPSLYRALGRIDILQSDDPAMYFQKALKMDPSQYDLSGYLYFLETGAVANPISIERGNEYTSGPPRYNQGYASYPSVVLRRERNFVLHEDGRSRVFCDDVIQVNNDEGVDKWREIRIPFPGEFRPVRMRVYDTRGSYTDPCVIQKMKEGTSVSISPLAKKTVIHLSYIVDDPIAAPRGSSLFSLTECLQNYDEPVLQAVVQVTAPAGMKVSFRFKTPVTASRSEIGDHSVYSETVTNIPPVRLGHRSDGRADYPYSYSFTTMQGFGDFVAWYGGLIREASGKSPLNNRVPVRKCKLEETISDVYDFVREIEPDGTMMFYPLPPETTLFRKKGSVENKALLARALLKDRGIRSYIALARNRSLPEAGEAVTHDYFTAILLYVPLDIDNALWLDFSDRRYPCGVIADNISGVAALVMMHDSFRFRMVRSRYDITGSERTGDNGD